MSADRERDAPASVEPSADALREAVKECLLRYYVPRRSVDWITGAILALPALRASEERAKRAEAELQSKDPAYTPLLDKYVSDIQAANDQVDALTQRVTELEAERDEAVRRHMLDENALDEAEELAEALVVVEARNAALTQENAKLRETLSGLAGQAGGYNLAFRDDHLVYVQLGRLRRAAALLQPEERSHG